MWRQTKAEAPKNRISSAMVAVMLERETGPILKKKRGRKRKSPLHDASETKRAAANRERRDALPPGHPVTWNALWRNENIPEFPGLSPMGAHERIREAH